MSLSPSSDASLAREIATRVGELLLNLRQRPGLSDKDLGDLADREANQLVLSVLQRARPSDAFLSEESPPDPARLGQHRVWIIDPLDGTREYSDRVRMRPDWAVHVALTEGGQPTASAVALPALGTTLASDRPLPLLPREACAPIRMVVSRSRAPKIAASVAEALGFTLVPMGSAGAKAMAVVRGEADAYLHDGGMFEWDTCAPVGVALASGLHASRIDGSPCIYNRADHAMPDLLICRPELAPALLKAVAEAKR